MDTENREIVIEDSQVTEAPRVIEEIAVEELSIDGICGVY
jgi:mycofactocin precursor